MTLAQYYRNAVIYPAILVFFIISVFSIIDNSDYQSEWLTAESVIIMSIVYSLVYSLLICGLATTIFLNKYEHLNQSLIWSALSWFLLPLGCIAVTLIHDINHRTKYESGFGSDFIYLLILTTPFIISLSWTFVKYRITRLPSTKANES